MARLTHCLLVFSLAATAAFCSDAAGYVGSKTCYGCHTDIYRSFIKTDMGRSMRPASELDQSVLPAEASVSIPSASRTLRVFHDADGWHQSESEPNVFVDEHKLSYAVGSGANGLSFLITRGNRLFQAPLSFYSKTGKWNLSPGYEYADYAFTRPIPEECVVCHTGRAQPLANHPGEYLDPPFEELAIGCENCHGPGEAHARDPKHGLIVNPAKLSPRLAENICMECHQGGDARITLPGKSYADIRPGHWLIDTFVIFKTPTQTEQQRQQDLLEHNEAMQASRCFRESAGKLSCLTCHDPHVQPAAREASTYFRPKCLTCHNEQSCKLPLATRQQQTPADDCIGCHMPKRAIATISHSALTNHRIPARSDEPLPAWKPSADTGLRVVDPKEGGKTAIPDITLMTAYNVLAAKSPEYQQRFLDLLDNLDRAHDKTPYVQAALAHKALTEGKNEQVLEYLETGIQFPDARVYLDKTKALENLGRFSDAAATLAAGVESYPYQQELRKTLILEYINLKRYTDARKAMEEYVGLFPEDSFMRKLLERVTH